MDKDFAPYETVAAHIRTLIRRGDLKPGERLASIGGLAQAMQCAGGTVERAYRILLEEGVIIKKWRAFEVVGDPRSLAEARLAALTRDVRIALERLGSAGYSADELRSAGRNAMRGLR